MGFFPPVAVFWSRSSQQNFFVLSMRHFEAPKLDKRHEFITHKRMKTFRSIWKITRLEIGSISLMELWRSGFCWQWRWSRRWRDRSLPWYPCFIHESGFVFEKSQEICGYISTYGCLNAHTTIAIMVSVHEFRGHRGGASPSLVATGPHARPEKKRKSRAKVGRGAVLVIWCCL